MVMKCSQEGIIKISQDLKIYQQRTIKIINYTEKYAVILASRADKYIFPYRSVWYLEKELDNYNFASLKPRQTPLYYFGFETSANIKLSEPLFIDGDQALYKIILD